MKQDIICIDLGGINSYLVKSEEGFLLVDTGGHITMDKVFTNRLEKLKEELDKAGVNEDNLKLIILTHGHNDHAANAAYLRELYHTKIAMHPLDAEQVEKPDMDKMMSSFQYRSVALTLLFKILKKKITKINQKTIDDFTPFTPDILLGDGDELSQYGFDVKIIHIPGHTQGSIGLLTGEGELICGDILANMKKPGKAPNAEDFQTLDKSIQKISNLKVVKLYPGHGKPFDAKEVFYGKNK